MSAKKLTSFLVTVILIALVGCSSTRMGGRPDDYINTRSYSYNKFSLATRIENRLSKFDVNVDVIPASYNRYDITVSWKMNELMIQTLLESDMKNETIGVVVGMMIVMAAVVGDEVGSDYQARNLVYHVNGEKFAYIPVSKCNGYMSLIVNKEVEPALLRFVNDVVLLG